MGVVMRFLLASGSWLLVTDAVAQPVATPSDLRLNCTGQYQDTESATGDSRVFKDGKWENGSVTVTREVMRDGVAKLTIRAPTGEITYPDGRRRSMTDVRLDEHRITGSYKRLGFMTWRMTIDRLTGEIEVKNGSSIGFRGICEVAPAVTQPKF